MAYLFLGIFLLIEGLDRLGASVWNKMILQGICLCIAGVIFIIQNL